MVCEEAEKEEEEARLDMARSSARRRRARCCISACRWAKSRSRGVRLAERAGWLGSSAREDGRGGVGCGGLGCEEGRIGSDRRGPVPGRVMMGLVGGGFAEVGVGT